MQTQNLVSAKKSAVYKAISITAARIAEKLAVLEKEPISAKGGEPYDSRHSEIPRK